MSNKNAYLKKECYSNVPTRSLKYENDDVKAVYRRENQGENAVVGTRTLAYVAG